MQLIKRVNYKGCPCNLMKSFYHHGNRVALCLIDAENGEPVATATVNIPEMPLSEDEILIKNYSENQGMLSFLEKEEIVQRTGRVVESGYVTIPVCILLV